MPNQRTDEIEKLLEVIKPARTVGSADVGPAMLNYRVGRLEIARKQFEKACKFYEGRLDSTSWATPTLAHCLYCLAMIDHKAGNGETARKTFQIAERRFRQHPESLLPDSSSAWPDWLQAAVMRREALATLGIEAKDVPEFKLVDNDAPMSTDEGSWVSLFNGRDLTGWKTHPDAPGGWTVEDGVLVGRTDQPKYLFSERGDYENFHLRMETRINKGGDSGLLFRNPFALTPLPTKDGFTPHAFPAGYEACIAGTEEVPGTTGSLARDVKLLVRSESRKPAPNTWFTLEIIAQNNHFVVKVDGEIAADHVDTNRDYKNGHLTLQAFHVGTVAQFRKIEIRELPPGGIEDTAQPPSTLSDFEIRRFVGHTSGLQDVCVLPDEKQIVSGGNDGTLRLWDLKTGRELRRFEGHSDVVRSMALLPGGRRIVSSSADRNVCVWDIETGDTLQKLVGHHGEVWDVAALPDGKRVVSASFDETLRVWNVDSGEQIKIIEVGEPAVSVAALPDGRHVLCGDRVGSLQLWDLNESSLVRRFVGHTHEIRAIAVSPDGRLALSSGGKDGTMRLWDIESGEQLRSFEGHGEWATGVAFGQDGKLALTGGARAMFLWDLETGERLSIYRAPCHFIDIEFLSDDVHVVSAGWANEEAEPVRLWQLPESVWPEKAVVERLDEVSASIKANPDDMQLFQQRGRLYAELGRYDEAARDFFRANELLASPGGWDHTSDVFDSLMQHDEVSARIAELCSNDLRYYTHRGRYHALRNQWDKALSDYARTNDKQFTFPFEYACILLLAGDEDGYRRLCDRLVTAFEETPLGNPHVTGVYTLSPHSGVEPERLLEWAQLRDQADRDRFSLIAVGLASYRAGEFAKAVEFLQEANEQPDASASMTAFPLALALRALERHEESQQWYRRGIQAVERETPATPNDPAGWAVTHWLRVNVWRREAEQAFGPLKNDSPDIDDRPATEDAVEESER
jgi:WD40 repeat protein